MMPSISINRQGSDDRGLHITIYRKKKGNSKAGIHGSKKKVAAYTTYPLDHIAPWRVYGGFEPRGHRDEDFHRPAGGRHGNSCAGDETVRYGQYLSNYLKRQEKQ